MPDSLSGDRETGRHAVQLRSRTGGATRIEITRLGHRPAVVASVGDAEHPSSLRAVDGANLAVAADTAVDRRIPLVFHLSSTGADVHEGVAATHGWGTAARALVRASGIVPTVVCVDGPAVSGPALFLGIADFSIMTAKAYAFVSGPRMVEQYTGVPINPESLGGAMLHARSDGAASFVVADRAATDDLVIELLTLLPTDTDSLPPIYDTDDPADRPNPDLLDMLPVSPQGSYDVRDIIREVVDDGEMLESRAAWAPNIITTLSTIAGRPVGIVANQPQSLAGTLDIPASQKGARFVSFCDAFNLPLITFVDTPGFYPGKDLEWRGMIRHGAQLAFAYARATVPRVCITLRKSYGGAYIVMDSKKMGNDLAFAWPTAEIAVMGAKGATEILHRKASPTERQVLETEYEERLLNPFRAADRGSIDDVIDPADTRKVVADALSLLVGKRERLRRKRHDNIPL